MRDQQHHRLKIYSWKKCKVSTINSSTPMLGYYGTIYDKIYDIIIYGVMWCDVTWPDMARHDKKQFYLTRHDMTWHFMTWHVMIWQQSFFSLDLVPSNILCKIYNNRDERCMLAPRKKYLYSKLRPWVNTGLRRLKSSESDLSNRNIRKITPIVIIFQLCFRLQHSLWNSAHSYDTNISISRHLNYTEFACIHILSLASPFL